MTRNTAREIAVHLAYELSFTDLPAEQPRPTPRKELDALLRWL